jgi:hypothetical protein
MGNKTKLRRAVDSFDRIILNEAPGTQHITATATAAAITSRHAIAKGTRVGYIGSADSDMANLYDQVTD